MQDSLTVEMVFVEDGELVAADGAIRIIDSEKAEIETDKALSIGQYLILNFWHAQNGILSVIDFDKNDDGEPVRFRVKAEVTKQMHVEGKEDVHHLGIRFLGPFRITHAPGGEANTILS